MKGRSERVALFCACCSANTALRHLNQDELTLKPHPHRQGGTAMNLSLRLIWTASICIAALAGCAGSANEETGRVDLQATGNNSGHIGYATLSAVGKTAGVEVFVNGVQGFLRPVRLYTYIYTGTCSAMGAKPVYEMNDQVTTQRTQAGWQYSRTAQVPLKDLRSTSHVLLLRSSPEEGSVDLFCGEIR
jgi:hypothetical protein